jgi:4-hydroxybenzoate polyprenyltransferase
MASRLRALRVVHPFPSFLNTALVLALAVVAGASVSTALILSVGMLGIQLCIGAVNDVCDADLDGMTKPWKPIAAGLISRRSALSIAIVSAAVAMGAAFTQGVAVAAMASAMLGAGLLYDLRLKPTSWAWACFSVAFAILPVYAWYGSTGQLPPLAQFLIPLAALAGPALQLSNGLVDIERDRAGGLNTLAARLGRRRALSVIGALLVVIYGLAWLTLSLTTGTLNLAVAGATVVAIAGFVLQTRAGVTARETGWSLQAVGIALLGLGWLSAVA